MLWIPVRLAAVSSASKGNPTTRPNLGSSITHRTEPAWGVVAPGRMRNVVLTVTNGMALCIRLEVDMVAAARRRRFAIMTSDFNRRWPLSKILCFDVTLWDSLDPSGTRPTASAVIGSWVPSACRGCCGRLPYPCFWWD